MRAEGAAGGWQGHRGRVVTQVVPGTPGYPVPAMRKPHSTLLLLGPRGHGKTSVAVGLSRASRAVGAGGDGVDEPACPQVLGLPRGATLTLAMAATEVESTRRRYTLLDPGDRHAITKRLIAGPLVGLAAVDGAVVVVDAGVRRGPALANELRLLRRVGVGAVVVVLNRAVGEDPEFVDLAEQELRVELDEAGFSGDATPIVRGSIHALRDGEAAGIGAALAVFEALDRQVVDEADERPRWVVAGVLAGEGGEPEVDCRVLRGALAVDERIEILGITATRMAQVVAVSVAPGEPGGAAERVRCRLRGVTAGELRVGQVLALPGTLALHGRFEAELWFVAPRTRQVEEWQLACHGVATVGGLARPIKDSAHGYEVELSSVLVLVPGDGFVVTEGGAVIGVGVVVAVRGAARKRRRGAASPTGLAMAFVDSLHRGDRPDVAASLLLPPDDVLQATAPGFCEEMRSEIRSGRILLRLVDDASRGNKGCVDFSYKGLLARPGSVEYVGPCRFREGMTRHVERGASEHVYFDLGERYEMREYRLGVGLTLARILFRIAVTRDGVREDMCVELSVAEFDGKPGSWFVFDFECPYRWQTW